MFVTQLLPTPSAIGETLMHVKRRKPCKTAKNETIHARKSLLKIDAGTLLGDVRVAADDQALAGKGIRADLGERALVEERELELPFAGQALHLLGLEGGDPAEAVLAECLDPGLGDHAAVADEDDPLDPEALPEPLDRRRERGVVVQAAAHDLDRERPALRRAGEAVVDLGLAAAAVAGVAELGERAAAALEVARREVVEDEPAG